MKKIIVHKGGPGSGHHGHGGLDDVHGGSTPGKGGKKVDKPKAKPSKSKKKVQVKRLAKKPKFKISTESAGELWFEYYNSMIIKAVSRGDVNITADVPWDYSEEDLEELRDAAEVLQFEAETTQSEHKRVYRGLALDSKSRLDRFKKGAIIEILGLTAASPIKEIASIYTDMQFGTAEREGLGVILHLENPNGVVGFLRDSSEIILPKGAKYRVTRIFTEDDIVNISLYSKDKSVKKDEDVYEL